MDHTTILVKTLDESTDFYRKILQLKELPALWGKTHWASFVGIGNNQQLHIAQVEADSVKLNKVHHIAFSVNDFDDYLKFLNENSIDYGNWQGES